MLRTQTAFGLILSFAFLATGYAQGSVTSVSPSNGPAAGQNMLTITGANFPNDSGLKVRIGDTEVAATWVSSTSITASAPTGYSTQNLVTVTFSTGAASSTSYYSYDAPVVLDIVPKSIWADTQAQSLTVTGSNFGPSADAKQSITINGVACNATKYVSDSSLTCTWSALTENVQSPTNTLPGTVVVTAGSQNSVGKSLLTFNPVSRTSSVYPDYGATVGGEVLTVYGSSFVAPSGTNPGTQVGFFEKGANSDVLVGYSTCVQYIENNPGKLYTLSPWGMGQNLIVKVKTNSYLSYLSEATFSYNPPVIDKICFPSNLTTATKVVGEVTGANYGVKNNSISLFIGTKNYTGTWVSDNKFTFDLVGDDMTKVEQNKCYSESGSSRRRFQIGSLGSVYAEVGSAGSTAPKLNSTEILVTSVFPNSDNTRGGSFVTISGFNFGVKNTTERYVDFPNSGYSACVEWISNKQLRVSVPAGYGTGQVIVRVGGQKSRATTSARFSYHTPEVYSISPLGKKIDKPNTVVTIRGRYFGWRDSQPLIKVGRYECENEVDRTNSGMTYKVREGWVSDSELFCKLTKADKSGVGQVMVEVGQVNAPPAAPTLVAGTVLSSEKSAYPVYFSFSTERGIVLPTAPSFLSISHFMGGTGALRASWKLPYNTGSGGTVAKIIKYRMQVSDSFSFSALQFDEEVLPCEKTGCVTTKDATGLVVGTLYYVRVAAINAAAQGPWARSSKVAAQQPSKPLNVAVSPASSALAATVTFNPPTDTGAGGSKIPLVAYRVKMVKVSDGTAVTQEVQYDASITTISAPFKNLVKGTSYSAQVEALNELGSSGYTTPAQPAGFVMPLSAPGVVGTPASSRPNPSEIALTWTAPSDSGHGAGVGTPPITQYQVAYSPAKFTSLADAGVEDQTLAAGTLTTTISSYKGEPLIAGTTYFLRVRAVNAAGPGAWTDPLSVQNAGKPDAPSPFTATSASLSAILSWTAPVSFAYNGKSANLESSYLTTYEAEIASNVDFTLDLVQKSTKNTTTTFTGLVKGSLYYARARAVNSLTYVGTNSDVLTVMGADKPSEPLAVVASPGLGGGLLKVTWSSPSDTGDGSDRFPLTGFSVQYSTSSTFATASTVAVSSAGAREHSIAGLSSSSIYYVRVAAKNVCGTGSYSTGTSGSPLSLPSSPTSLSVTSSGVDVALTWVAPTGTISSYRIAVSSDFFQERLYYYYSTSGTSTYTVAGLPQGYRYTFSVSAGNAAGYSSAATSDFLFNTVGDVQIAPNEGPLGSRSKVFITGRVLAGANLNSQSFSVAVTQGATTSQATIDQRDNGSGSGAFRLAVTMPVGLVSGLASVDVTAYGLHVLKTSFLYSSPKDGRIAQILPRIGTPSASMTILLRNFPTASDGYSLSDLLDLTQYAVTIAPSTQLYPANSASIVDAKAGVVRLTVKPGNVVTSTASVDSVTVTVTHKLSGYAASSGWQYRRGATMDLPRSEMLSVAPQSGSFLGGDTVTLVGDLRLANSGLTTISGTFAVGGASYSISASRVAGTTNTFTFVTPNAAAIMGNSAPRYEIAQVSLGSLPKFTFTYYIPTPVVVSMTPATGLVGSTSNTVDVMVHGFDGKVTSASDVTFTFGGVSATGHLLSLENDGFLQFRVTAPISSVAKSSNVVVAHSVYPVISATAGSSFEYLGANSAQVVDVVPATGSTSGGTIISVSLKGASSSTALSASIQMPSGATAAATVVEMLGDDVVLLQMPASSETGLCTVSLQVGSRSASFGFTYQSPLATAASIDYVQPQRASPGSTVVISLTGFSVINSASDVRVTFGSGGTVAPVTNIQSTLGRTTLFVTTPKHQPGLTTLVVTHTGSASNTASAPIEVMVGSSSPYPRIVSYAPEVAYLKDSGSGASDVSVIVHSSEPLPSGVELKLFGPSQNVVAFKSVSVEQTGAHMYKISGPVPYVDGDSVAAGLVSIKPASSPLIELPFALTMIAKPTSGEWLSHSGFPSAGGAVVATLAGFARVVEDPSAVQVFVSEIACVINAVRSDPTHTVVEFVAPACADLLGACAGMTRVTIRDAANAKNTATTEIKYAPSSGTPVIQTGSVSPSRMLVEDLTSGSVALAFAIDLNHASGKALLPKGTYYLIGQGPSPVTFKARFNVGTQIELSADKNDIKLVQDNGMLYVSLSVSASDFSPSITASSPGGTLSIEVGGAVAVSHSFEVQSLSSATPEAISVTPNKLAVGMESQQIEVLVRGYPKRLANPAQVKALIGGATMVVNKITAYKSSAYYVISLTSPTINAAGAQDISISSVIDNSVIFQIGVTAHQYAPLVKSISPAQVSTSGGARIVMTVQKYPSTSNPTVYIGGVQVAVASMTVDTQSRDATVTVITPPMPVQQAVVTVSDASASSNGYVAAAKITITDLNVVDVYPTAMSGPGGSKVIIRVRDLGVTDPSMLSVKFGTLPGLVAAISPASMGISQVTVMTPTHPPMARVPSVLSVTAASKSFPFDFTFVNPSVATLVSLSPSTVSAHGGVMTATVKHSPDLGTKPELSMIVQLVGPNSVITCFNIKVIQVHGMYTDISFEVPKLNVAGTSNFQLKLSMLNSAVFATAELPVGDSEMKISSIFPQQASAGQTVQIVMENVPTMLYSASEVQVSLDYGYHFFASELLYSRRGPAGITAAVNIHIPNDVTPGSPDVAVFYGDAVKALAKGSLTITSSTAAIATTTTSVSSLVNHKYFTYLNGNLVKFPKQTLPGPSMQFVTPSVMPASGTKTVHVGLRLADPSSAKFKVTWNGSPIADADVVSTSRTNQQVCPYAQMLGDGAQCEATQDGDRSVPTNCAFVPYSSTCELSTVILKFDVPATTGLPSVVGTVRITNAATSTQLIFTQSISSSPETVNSVTPSSVPMVGGVQVRVEINKFNSGFELLANQVRAYVGGTETTVLSIKTSSDKAVLVFVAPASALPTQTVKVVPMNDATRAVSFELKYFSGCGYDAFCGHEGVNSVLLMQSPPLSQACLVSYCAHAAPLPELRYGTMSAYTKAANTVIVGVKNPLSLSPADFAVSFGDHQGAVIAVRSIGTGLAEVSILTPYVTLAQTMTMTLSWLTSDVGSVSDSFVFYNKPTGASSVTALPGAGAAEGGTAVTLSLTNFPVITSTSQVSVSFGNDAASALRLVSSAPSATELIATTPTGTTGAVTLSVSHLDGLSASNTGSTSFAYLPASPKVASVYPAQGSYLGNFEMVVSLTGYPAVSAVGDVTFMFNTYMAVQPSVVLYSDAYLTKLKVTVPAAPSVGDIGQLQSVQVRYNANPAYLSTFRFTYSAGTSGGYFSVKSVNPPSGATDKETSVALQVTGWAVPANLDPSSVIVNFGNYVGKAVSWESGVLTVSTPLVAAAGLVRGYVYLAKDAGTSTQIASFDFTYTDPGVTLSTTVATNYMPVSVTATIGNFYPRTNSKSGDWYVSFPGESFSQNVQSTTATYKSGLGGQTDLSFRTPTTTLKGSQTGSIMYLPTGRTWTFDMNFIAQPKVTAVLPRARGKSGDTIFVELENTPMTVESRGSVRWGEFGSNTVPELVSSNQDRTVVKLMVPGGSTGAQTVSFFAAGGTTPLASFSYDYVPGCQVTAVVPSFAPSYGGARITIVGTGFNALREDIVQVRFGNSYAKVLQVMQTNAHSTIVVASPPAPSGVVKVSVLVNSVEEGDYMQDFAIYDKFSQASTTSGALSSSGVQAPEISAVAGSAQSISVKLTDFPISGVHDVTVKYGSSFATISALTSTHVTVTPPLGSVLGAKSAPLLISYVGPTGTSNTALVPATVYSSPGVASSVFDRGRAQLIISFDMQTNTAGMSGSSYDCSLVLSGQNLGINSYCVWDSSSRLVVNLGSGSMVKPGDRLQFVPNRLSAPGVTYSAASAAAFSSGSFAIEEDVTVQFPAPVIVAPQEVGPCADVHLSSVGTTPMANVEYFWGCSNDAIVDNALKKQSGAQATVANAHLQKSDFVYKFTLSVKLSSGTSMSNVATADVKKLSMPVLSTTLRASPVVKAGLPFTVEAFTSFSECPGYTGEVVYEWTHLLGARATSSGQFLSVKGQQAGSVVITVKTYIKGDPTMASTATLTVYVEPGPLSAAVFTGLPYGCETTRTVGEILDNGQQTFKSGARAPSTDCQSATTVSSKKVGFDAAVLLTPVVSDPSASLAYDQYSFPTAGSQGLATSYSCMSSSGIPCDAFGIQRPQYNTIDGIDAPVSQKFMQRKSVTSGLGEYKFDMSVLQPYDKGSADNNPFYETDVVYDEPIRLTMTSMDASTSRSVTATTTAQFSKTASALVDFLLVAETGVYIDGSGQPYVRPNEAASFTFTTGRQPVQTAATWSWAGDNVPGVSLPAGKSATIPAQSLKPGVSYTLRAAQSAFEYDEITFYVDTPPTRGSCSAEMSSEGTVTVTCSDFSVPGGTSGFPGVDPAQAELLYQYGYYEATNGFSFFSTTTHSQMSFCIPPGVVEPWVKVINYKGSATFTKAKFASTPTYYTAANIAVTEASVAYNGVNGGTIGGKYDAWAKLGRIELVSQCAYVWASANQSALSETAWNTAIASLVTSVKAASAVTSADPSVGMLLLQTAAKVAESQVALVAAHGTTNVKDKVASQLCDVAEIAQAGATSVKQAADLATLRAVSLAPYQFFPLQAASYPSLANMTVAMNVISQVSKANQQVLPATPATPLPYPTCSARTATALGLVGDYAAAAAAQNTMTAASLPQTVEALSSSLAGSKVTYSSKVLSATYPGYLEPVASSLTYTDVYEGLKDKPKQFPPYAQATQVTAAMYQMPAAKTFTNDLSYLGVPQSIGLAGSLYSATVQAAGLSNGVPFTLAEDGWNPSAPQASRSVRAGEHDLYVDYRVMEQPSNWHSSDVIASRAVYGYTVAPVMKLTQFAGAGWDSVFPAANFAMVKRKPNLPATSVVGPMQIVVPVDSSLLGLAGGMTKNDVACAHQDLTSTATWTAGSWNTDYACSDMVPVLSSSLNPGCVVASVSPTTVTCTCWSSPRANVLVQKFDRATRCPGCDGVLGSGKIKDSCGVCGGNGSSCVPTTPAPVQMGCDGLVFDPAKPMQMDVCGVCNGDNSTCMGCAPTNGTALPLPAGGLVFDACGVCGGDGSTCSGCDNVPYSGKKFDKCKICGGNSDVSYPEFGFECVGKIISPAAKTRFTVKTGKQVSIIVKAKASSNNNQITMRPTDMAALGAVSYVAPAGKSSLLGENVTFTFTWTPSVPMDREVCVNLEDTTGTPATLLDSRCFTISVVFCQAVAEAGDTLKTIALKQFGDEKRSRTLWWLNPLISYMDQPLTEGQRVDVGRRFKVAKNDTLKYYVNEFGSKYKNVVIENPLKVFHLQGGKNLDDGVVVDQGLGKPQVVDVEYQHRDRQVTYDGTEFCIVSEMDSASRY